MNVILRMPQTQTDEQIEADDAAEVEANPADVNDPVSYVRKNALDIDILQLLCH
jgi:hypothetical protein